MLAPICCHADCALRSATGSHYALLAETILFENNPLFQLVLDPTSSHRASDSIRRAVQLQKTRED